MALTSGTRLGPYEIVAAIGAGGMGEVYRATDSNLKRSVAIKVLPASVAGDADRLARFQREAEVLAALNHPNIAAIYGLEKTPDVTALVMELVEGEDLSVQIARGAMPPGEALVIARQIAEALEAAHDLGIVHRDLKPANIKVRPDGTVKVLDFGLAKALDANAPGATADAMNSPTLTARATQMGTILGTAAYMAPEQAKGKPVDRRADIWAFGVVLFEMLTGKRAFDAEDVSETLAAVLTREPEFGAVPASTPASVVTLLRRCLERDPKRRLRDIGEARLTLEAPMADRPAAPEAAVRRGSSTSLLFWRSITAVLLVTLLAGAFQWWRSSRPENSGPVRAAILLPPGVVFDFTIYSVIAVSPDGSKIAVIGSSGGVRRLYVRHLGEFEARLLEGTEDASSPFFSPEGNWVGFFAAGKLKKVPADGGPVIPLADAQDNRGGAWTKDDQIVFAPASATPIFAVPAGGGTAKAVSTIDEAKHERTHRWPALLPDGKTVLITVGSVEHVDDYDEATIQSLRLDTGERRVVIPAGRTARYAPTGHLLFLRGKLLYAVPFDSARGVAGDSPAPIIDGVSGDVTTGSANYAIADSGAVVFVPGDPMGGDRRLVWVDKKGAPTPIDATPAFYSDPHVAPDGRRVAVAVMGTGSNRDIYVIDTVRGTPTPLTFGGENHTPVWSPDGLRLIYVAYDRARNVSVVMRRTADGSGEAETLSEIDGAAYVDDIAGNGSTLAITSNGSTARGRYAVFSLAVQKGAKAVMIASSPVADASISSLSPDGKWIAYSSNPTGRGEIYVQSFPSGGNRSQVSKVGGNETRWAPDSRTLYYSLANKVMAVPLDPGAGFNPGKAEELFSGTTPAVTDSGKTFAVDPKTGRFLMLRPAHEGSTAPEIRLILNWFDELRALKFGK